MVRKIFSFIEREISGVHNAAYLLGLFAFLSQCLALVRDRLLASHFGAGAELDVYYSAFRIPDFIFASIASLVSISVLIPFLAKLMEKDAEEHKNESKKFLDTIFSAYMILIVVVSAIIFFLIPYLSQFILPNLTQDLRNEFIFISRILLLQPIALGISNLLGSVTQVTRRFFIYALGPLFYNAAIIFGIIFLAPTLGLQGIAIGVVIGSVLHFAIQIPYITSLGMLPMFSFRLRMSELKKVALLSLPRTLTLSLTSLELIFITFYASYMETGSISVFNFALNLQSVPFAIIGVSYSLAAFPTLSRLFSNGERSKFLEHVETAARHIVFWSLPVVALFIVLRAQIVRTILGSGNFNWEDTRLTAACLSLFVISLVAQSLELLFIRAYYAAGNTKKPLVINLISSVLTIALPFVFIVIWQKVPVFAYFIETLFKVSDVTGSIVLALPLGFSVGTIINMVILWASFQYDFKGSLKGLARIFWHSFAAAVIMGFISYLSLVSLSHFLNTATTIGIFLQGFIAGLIGILAGVGVFSLLRSPELKEALSIIPGKVFKAKNVVLDEASKIE